MRVGAFDLRRVSQMQVKRGKPTSSLRCLIFRTLSLVASRRGVFRMEPTFRRPVSAGYTPNREPFSTAPLAPPIFSPSPLVFILFCNRISRMVQAHLNLPIFLRNCSFEASTRSSTFFFPFFLLEVGLVVFFSLVSFFFLVFAVPPHISQQTRQPLPLNYRPSAPILLHRILSSAFLLRSSKAILLSREPFPPFPLLTATTRLRR